MSGYVEQGEVVRNEQIGSDVWIMDIRIGFADVNAGS